MRRVAGIALCLLLALPCVAYGASKGGGISVTPLDDEFAGQSAPLYTPPGPKGESGAGVGGQAGMQTGEHAVTVPTAQPASNSASASLTPGGDTKDSLVIAYLIDLARKQNKPCPSGATPPLPPALVFSEPLCKAAKAANGGAEPLAAITEQGVYAAKWRMFSAENAPPQRVVNGLRQAHCEALLEPFTHVGAYRDAGGWRILLATLTDKPAEGESAPAQEEAQPAGAPTQAAIPEATQSGQAVQAAPAARPEGEAASAAVLGGFKPKEPEGAAGIAGQEARALFMLFNELRAKGGVCFGKELPPAPAVAFSPELQAVAEKEVQTSVAAASSGSSPAGSNGGMLYKGSNMTKLTLKANNHASVALDVWMVSPSQCETLLSPMFIDAGAAYEGGYWVLMLGGKNQGVPSDK